MPESLGQDHEPVSGMLDPDTREDPCCCAVARCGSLLSVALMWSQEHSKRMTLCVQEVVGTDESALDAVVAADAELMALRAEEADIQQRLGGISLEDAPEVPSEAGTTAASDADNDRLAAIYDRLEVGSTYPKLLQDITLSPAHALGAGARYTC